MNGNLLLEKSAPFCLGPPFEKPLHEYGFTPDEKDSLVSVQVYEF
jgi:hypothetical protein